MRQSGVTRLARWPARSQSSEGGAVGGAVSGGRRVRAGGGGSGGGGSWAVHRKRDRTGMLIWALEAPHGPVAAFDAAVILLQPIVQGGAGPVPHILAQRRADGAGVAVVAVRRDPVRRDAGHRFGGAEARLGGCHI